MCEAARFSSLILSRPRRARDLIPRVQGIALAVSFDLAAVVAFLLAPYVFLEAMRLPEAKADEPPIDILLSPPGRTGGPSGGGSRAGSLSGARPAEVLETLRRQRSLTRPIAKPISPPVDDPHLPDPTSNPGPARGGTGVPGGAAAGPGGEGDGGMGDGQGPGCCGGSGGPGAGEGLAENPILEWDARIVRPSLIQSSRVLPKYPDHARKARVEGTVVLAIVIERDGAVGDIEVLAAPDARWGFERAAIGAVRRWRYRPGLMNGRPIAVRAWVTVEFHLAR